MAKDGEQFAKATLDVRDSSLKAWEKLLLIYLKDAMGNNGAAWPSRETLARWCSVSSKTISRAIGNLESKGLLAVKRHPSSKGWSNEYTVLPKGLSVPHYPESPIPRDCESRPQGLRVPTPGTESPTNQTKEPDQRTRYTPPTPPGDYSDEVSPEIKRAACAWKGKAAWAFIARLTRDRITEAVEAHGEESVLKALEWGAKDPKGRTRTQVMGMAAGLEIAKARAKEKNNGSSKPGHAPDSDPEAKFRAYLPPDKQ